MAPLVAHNPETSLNSSTPKKMTPTPHGNQAIQNSYFSELKSVTRSNQSFSINSTADTMSEKRDDAVKKACILFIENQLKKLNSMRYWSKWGDEYIFQRMQGSSEKIKCSNVIYIYIFL